MSVFHHAYGHERKPRGFGCPVRDRTLCLAARSNKRNGGRFRHALTGRQFLPVAGLDPGVLRVTRAPLVSMPVCAVDHVNDPSYCWGEKTATMGVP